MIQRRIDVAGARSHATRHEDSCRVPSRLTVASAVSLVGTVLMAQAMPQANAQETNQDTAQQTAQEAAIAVSPSAPGPDSDGDSFHRRFYVGAGALLSQLKPDADDDDSLVLDDDRSVGGSVLAGYDVSNRFAVEAHIASLGEATLSPEGEIAYQVGGLSGLVYGLNDEDDRRLREGLSVFGRLGVGTLRNQAEDVEFERVNDVHLLAGFGVEYGVMNGMALRAEIVAHETDAKFAQMALLYRFGGTRFTDGADSPMPADALLKAPDDSVDGDGAGSASDDVRIAAVPVPPKSTKGTSLDADDDGVVDARDRCTDTRIGIPVDEQGCDALDGVVEGVSFDAGSDRLTPGSQGVLRYIATTLRDQAVVNLTIEAHTDNQGSAQSNLDLSRRRALAVARYLASQGVEPQRLKLKAFGESRPRSSNATPEGRAANRRVEISTIE